MTYSWRLRVSRAATFVGTDHPSWRGWSQATFRTPKASSATLSPVQPAQDVTVPTWVPILQWANSPDDVFYYEMQLSKDSNFNTDPATATASVYGALIHGGVTTPLNSYAVPTNFPLEPSHPLLLAGASACTRRWDASGLEQRLELQDTVAGQHLTIYRSLRPV